MMERFDILSNLIEFIPIQTIFPSMVAVAMALGVGIGLSEVSLRSADI